MGIVTGDWVRYLEVLNRTSRKYGYTTEIAAENLTLLKLDADMSLHQLWGRRCTQTVSKLNYVSTFVTRRVANSSEEEKAVFGAIVQDYISREDGLDIPQAARSKDASGYCTDTDSGCQAFPQRGRKRHSTNESGTAIHSNVFCDESIWDE
ncbi:hypothetical protein HYALB_00006843 [Hymenoscyphus albidus]|uniref:Uncharacterized protein n=1 Tax=Hymenoscyphus albidus TaxID=595503 RepID=A0A9N9Q422_9HELO|nr:hypothetical protein HYALB_00006843 [Hymenoscyphus albidus]